MMSSELDRLVAAKVMGWGRRTNAETCGYEPDDKDWAQEYDNQWWLKGEAQAYVDDEGLCREEANDGWSPSTSPADAWGVVEKMRRDGWGLSITDPFAGKFRLMFTRDPSNGEVGVCEIPTGPNVMPLAVCKAALCAVGGR